MYKVCNPGLLVTQNLLPKEAYVAHLYLPVTNDYAMSSNISLFRCHSKQVPFLPAVDRIEAETRSRLTYRPNHMVSLG